MRASVTLRVAWTALLCVSAQAQGPVPVPTKNPFDRPGFMVTLIDAAPERASSPVRLELRATLVSSERMLANINGTILAPGDSFEGYRLEHVQEGRAIVSKEGERVTLDVYERQQGAGESRD